MNLNTSIWFGATMIGSSKLPRLVRFRRAPWVTRSVLAAVLVPFAPAVAAAPEKLTVAVLHGLPGLNHSALSRFVAAHMADAGLAEWRFEPAKADTDAPDRVEWTFRLNPYAGGEVRNLVRAPVSERGFGVHRPMTIEVRLFRNGEYQTVVERQVMIQGGPNDPELAAAVASATESLLGPSGAYRAIQSAQRPASHAR
jgi:hypothetical protein